ncbi:MAG: haloacid dehalogenase-like hydrolase [Deltaproteobacteria bacterium]|nr:haloacid dehalogenase-like hydrolase [Deltaproteobacteria bacterium]
MNPLAGAVAFLNWLRAAAPVIVVSDTYVEFVHPLMEKLSWPTLFCHHLSVGADGTIENYNLRQPDSKYRTVLALKSLNFTVISIGDSYNDITMLKEADRRVPVSSARSRQERVSAVPGIEFLTKT